MIVDFQHHYIPKELAQRQGLYSEKPEFAKLEGGIPRLTMHARLYDAEMQLRDMDEAGVDVSVLSCLLGWDASLEDNRFINDALADIQKKFPGRFAGLAQAPLLGGAAALEEFDRGIKELGLHGVAITSQFRGLPLDSEQLYPFYEKITALDVPIFVHPAMVPEGYELLLDYDLPRILGREVDLAVAATRIVAGGVLKRFPSLEFVIGHFGGGIAGVKDRLVAKAYRFGTLDKPFEDYFDMLYFDMAGFEGGITALGCALQGIRSDRLVFATDYPQDFTGVSTDTGKGMSALKEYIRAIRALDLDEGAKEAMLGGTAAKLLGLKE